MAKQPVNKKIARKKKTANTPAQREHLNLITESVKELQDASNGVRLGTNKNRELMVTIAHRIKVVKEKVGFTPSLVNAITNWANFEKGLRILNNDINRVDASWSKEILRKHDKYNMPVVAYGIATQYMDMAQLLNEQFIPAIVVLDDAITNYIEHGTEITVLPIGKSMVEHHEDGTTTEHTAEEAAEHLSSIMNPTPEDVDSLVGTN